MTNCPGIESAHARGLGENSDNDVARIKTVAAR
jgi:hypothetical protein